MMWGRSLYQNIQRFILFQLVVNVVACFIVVIGAFTGKQSPLTVTQMLWVNLIMDTFAALAFASLPPSEDVMKNKPRRSGEFILNKSMITRILSTAILFVVLLFGLMQYLHHANFTVGIPLFDQMNLADYFRSLYDFGHGHEFTTYEVSMFFSIFVFVQIWNLFNAKAFESGHTAFYKIKDSKVFFLVVIGIMIGQYIIVTFGGQMFSVTPLRAIDWLGIFLITMPIMLLPLLWTLLGKGFRYIFKRK